MIHETNHDPHSFNAHQIEAERNGDEVERLIDESATLFARLFLQQVLDGKRKNCASDADSGDHAATKA